MIILGVISNEENNKYYIEQYYNEILSKLNLEDIYKKLDGFTVLSFDNSRHVIAAWLELFLGIEIPEKKAYNYALESADRLAYIKEYLENIMKESLDMKGFNSLKALYSYEKGENFERSARISNDSVLLENLMEHADYFKCIADEVEREYNKNHPMIK